MLTVGCLKQQSLGTGKTLKSDLYIHDFFDMIFYQIYIRGCKLVQSKTYIKFPQDFYMYDIRYSNTSTKKKQLLFETIFFE